MRTLLVSKLTTMIARGVLTLLILIAIGCSKVDNDLPKSTGIEKKQSGIGYFKSTDETWFYEIYLSGIPMEYRYHERFYFSIDSITEMTDSLGNEVRTAYLHRKDILVPDADTSDKKQRSKNLILRYNASERKLYTEKSEVLIDFKDYQQPGPCFDRIIDYDTIRLGSRLYPRFRLSQIDMLEGIDLATLDCIFDPPIANYEIPKNYYVVTRMWYSNGDTTYSRVIP